jgi:hypothetical protein
MTPMQAKQKFDREGVFVHGDHEIVEDDAGDAIIAIDANGNGYAPSGEPGDEINESTFWVSSTGEFVKEI